MIVTIASFKGGVGKTTTSLHLAAYFNQSQPTLLVDGDLNRSALQWSEDGKLPFKVCDEKQAVKFSRQFEHIVVDTAARPAPEELKVLAEGCDLLVIPTSPDSLSIGATLQMIDVLSNLRTHYKILLTIVPPKPNPVGEEARLAIASTGLPLFKANIRRLAVFGKAAAMGVLVSDVPSDRYAGIAWNCYKEVGREIERDAI